MANHDPRECDQNHETNWDWQRRLRASITPCLQAVRLGRNKLETIAKPNRHEPIAISGRPIVKWEMTMIKVGSKEEIALLLALFGVLDLPVQAPKRK
jgi:hypothetical protein